jgi:hypothetical protein
MKKITKKARLIEALMSGKDLSVAQIKSRFNIANPTATISDIRLNSGIAIFTTRTAHGAVYRAGKAPRKVVAAGYRALTQKAKPTKAVKTTAKVKA